MPLNQVIDWLQGPRAEQTARAVALLLGVWLLYRMATLVWQIVPAPALPEGPVAPVNATSTAPARPRLDVAEVVNWHLFGNAAAPAPGTTGGATGPIDAPETRLNLVLRGVLSSDNPKEAHAIIAEPNGTENFFRVGAALPGGAELKEIYADRIILMRAGRPETLRLPREAVEGAGGDTVPDGMPTGSRGIGPTRDPSALLGEYRDQMAQNPQALLDLARAIPAPAPGGGIAGFRLFPGNKPALFAQLGLQPGDLVKEVNGLVLDNPMRGPELMQRLRESNQLDLRIERAGQEMNLSVALP
ncbi:MAG: type II secretion system protein GspC [Gammaproteobacteria bacterium]|nr:type II secretion system protein GspC [Gammaproteobacteria bacterium]